MHPSITLLVRYRSQVYMLPCDGYTSHFKLQSQATLLEDRTNSTTVGHSTHPAEGTVALYCGPFQGSSWCHDSLQHSQSFHSPQHLLESRIADQKLTSGRAMLPVHSPLPKQSLLLAFPPLNDMLKFGGSFHVHQVTPCTLR